jgi:AAA+ superfamily predicted ATPase
MAAIDEVRSAVAAFLGCSEPQSGPDPPESRVAPGPPPALETLCALFGLTPFERRVLLLCAGIELDSRLAGLCASRPTFSVALAAFEDAHWSALSPSRPLRYWRLVEVMPGEALTTSALRIDERILHYFAGVESIDERLRPLLKRVPVPQRLAPSHREVAEEAAAVWSRAHGKQDLPAIQLCGAETATRLEVAAEAAALLGAELQRIPAGQIPHAAADLDVFLRLWDREAALNPAVLLVDIDDATGSDALSGRALDGLIESFSGPLFISTRSPRRCRHRYSTIFEVHPLTTHEQAQIWSATLEEFPGVDDAIAEMASQFNLSPVMIQSLASQAQHAGGVNRLWDACRLQVRPSMDGLAQRIEPAAVWEDLVLPEKQKRILNQISIQVRQRAKVYYTWGFAPKGSRGLGISALFAGPSGTGKTMAAEVLANDLRLDLYHIDLSQVVSKYIGETEKNLRRVFDAAEAGAAILLFDEADALFGKRSDVKDSHDRYANIEISYLLQKMEAYRGLAILTTNRKSALDQAFLRRIRFAVEFPFPEAEQRAEIWRRIFPTATPVEDLRIDRLARLNASGGHIRNIAMGAAFLAADAREPVRMSHLLTSARSEFAKMERPLTDAEVGGWV